MALLPRPNPHHDRPAARSADDCPACGRPGSPETPRWEVETPRGRNPWTRCRHCRAYYLLAPYELDAEVAHTETLPWGEREGALALNDYKQRMFRAVLALLRRHRPPPTRILDIGCSYGGFAIEATRRGYDVCGMDITPGAVDQVRSLGMAAECCASVSELTGIDDEALDVVTCLDCHALWPDQPGELRAIHRKLRPGGILVLRVIDKAWLFGIGRVFGLVAPTTSRRIMRQAVNDNRFAMPLSSLEELLDECGFAVVERSIRAAVHSDDTRAVARASFELGAALYPIIHRSIAPGVVLVARRR